MLAIGFPRDFDAALERMIPSAKKFDTAKIKTDDVARSGGVAEEWSPAARHSDPRAWPLANPTQP